MKCSGNLWRIRSGPVRIGWLARTWCAKERSWMQCDASRIACTAFFYDYRCFRHGACFCFSNGSLSSGHRAAARPGLQALRAIMYRSILVPLDGSNFGEHALPLAASIARRAGARLTLAHVHEPITTLYGEGAMLLSDDLDVHARTQKRAYLERVIARLGRAAPPTFGSLLLEGGVIEAIQEQVVKDAVDLVVMTTHGRGPLGRFWLGSVADKLLRQLDVPLLLVHPGQSAPDLAADRVIKHVL